MEGFGCIQNSGRFVVSYYWLPIFGFFDCETAGNRRRFQGLGIHVIVRIEPEITSVSLVMLGSFNPAILTPAWFAWRGLLPEKTVDIADLKVAHPMVTEFEAEWLSLQVMPERFSISTTQSPFVRLEDLAVRIFREHLPHTRLKAMGINREVHFQVNSFEVRDRVGRLLAPIEPWGEWGKELEPDGKHGGMISLTMRQVKPGGRPIGGHINVTVEPSARVGENRTGIYVRVNDHFEVENPEGESTTTEVVTMLQGNFDESLRRADQIIDHLMSLGGER